VISMEALGQFSNFRICLDYQNYVEKSRKRSNSDKPLRTKYLWLEGRDWVTHIFLVNLMFLWNNLRSSGYFTFKPKPVFSGISYLFSSFTEKGEIRQRAWGLRDVEKLWSKGIPTKDEENPGRGKYIQTLPAVAPALRKECSG